MALLDAVQLGFDASATLAVLSLVIAYHAQMRRVRELWRRDAAMWNIVQLLADAVTPPKG